MQAAAQADSTRLVELRAAGDAPDINTQDWQGRTALFHAARHGRTENLRLLLKAGADVNKADNGGLTPLYAAAWFGHADCVKVLLETPGICPCAENGCGETAFAAAHTNGHDTCMELLYKTRKEAALAELKKRNITDANTQRFLAETALLEDDTETLQLLLDAEVIIPGEPDAEGKTPLDRANRYGSKNCAELLRIYE